jgi:hypothetical protein
VIRVTIQDKRNSVRRFYDADLTVRQADRHNNYALVSCGLTVPDDLRGSTLQRWINQGSAREITFEEWNR